MLGTGEERLQRWRDRVDGPLTVLAIGTLPLLFLEFEREALPASDRFFIDAVNIIVLVAFAVDYLIELYLAVDQRRYVRTEWSNLLIVAAQGVAVLPHLTGFGILRAARGARGIRIAQRPLG